MASFLDLITVPTKTAFVNKFIELLRLAGFPVASWHSGSLQKHTVETESSLLSELSASVRNVAMAAFIRLCKDLGTDWVELNAYEAFDEEPKLSLTTLGTIRVADVGGVGPITKQASSYWVGNVDRSLRYKNLVAFTVPLNGFVDVTFEAESPGADWNIGVGGITEQLTPEPGLAVSNPAQTSGTWVTRQGADRETPESLIQRCIDKWSTLGSGSNDAAYRYYATTPPDDATDEQRAYWAEVTRVRVYSPAPGSVRIVIAGPRGPVSSAALAAVAAYITTKKPSGVWDVVTSGATVNAPVISGTLVVSGVDLATAKARAQAAVDAYAAIAPIGGYHTKISREALVKQLMVDGVEDLDGILPAADILLASDEVFVPSYNLTAVYAQ